MKRYVLMTGVALVAFAGISYLRDRSVPFVVKNEQQKAAAEEQKAQEAQEQWSEDLRAEGAMTPSGSIAVDPQLDPELNDLGQDIADADMEGGSDLDSIEKAP